MNRNSNERSHQELMSKIEAFEEGVEEGINVLTKKGQFPKLLPLQLLQKRHARFAKKEKNDFT